MRFSAVETIYEAALHDPRIFFLTGDTGHAKEAEFRTKIPDQYMNTGMAEQNMIGVAAGLALAGMKVFTYGIVPFLILRAFEQIKVDVCYQNVDVTMVGVGGGFAYGVAGATHYSIEEVAALRALPHMKIVSPATPCETRQLTAQILKTGGPAYLRIGKGGEPDVAGKEPRVELGRAMVMRQGKDAIIFASGTIVLEALRAADILSEHGTELEVVNIHTLKPFDAATVAGYASLNKPIFTLEEQNIHGGLGSAVAEVLAEHGERRGVFKRFGVNDDWPRFVGTQQFLRSALGISAQDVADGIQNALVS